MQFKSITFVCQVFYPDTQSTSQLFTDLFEELVKNGMSIRVVTGKIPVEGKMAVAQENYRGIEIYREGMAVAYKRGYVQRALHYASFMFFSTLRLWKLRKNTLVFGVTNPPMTPVWLWLMSFLFIKNYEIMLLDIFPDGLVALKMMSEKSLTARLWSWANKKALAKARRVLVLGRDMGELVQQRYHVPADRIVCIPHCSSFVSQGMLSAEETQLYKKLNLAGKFVVQYSGNMGLWHDIETIVRAAGLLKAHPQIHFVMVGDGIRKKKAFELAGELQLTNMTWLPFQPKETLSDSLSCCHAALISQCEGLQGVAVPCKLYGILASGRPILGMVPKGSEIDRVIAEEHCGISLNAAQPEDLANAIIKLANNPQEAVNMGKNSFFAYKSKYQIESAVSQFKALWKNEVALKSR